MRPSSVVIPVLVTITCPRPWITSVPINTIFRRSPKGASSVNSILGFLITASASPVKAASRTCKFWASTRRPSAGICTPASRNMISPGTSSFAASSSILSSRTTRTLGEDIRFRAAKACSARLSWK